MTPHPKTITLRQLMSHRSGLMREPPVGHYFDLEGPSLEETVASLSGRPLVHAPESRTKYSNAGLAVVGRVVEVVSGMPFDQAVRELVLAPTGMTRSAFVATPEIAAASAKGVMWTLDGRTFTAPSFALGMVPAGDLYSSPVDLGRFLHMLLAKGRGEAGSVVTPEMIDQMWTPQFVAEGVKTGFGLGFMLSEFEGTRRVGHSGAVYGFATELAALPDEGLGCAVISTKDCANAISERIADEVLRQMLAVRRGKPAPEIETTQPINPAEAHALTGRYEGEGGGIELIERDGRLYLFPLLGGSEVELRRRGNTLVADGPLSYGLKVEPRDNAIRLGARELKRVAPPEPQPMPEAWKGLIGEYGWDHNTLFILEREGKLNALIEWFFLYPLEQVDADTYRFPNYGMYDNQTLVFTRDASGRATKVSAAEVEFPRRALEGEGKPTFRVKPAMDVAQARRLADAALPPVETGPRRVPDLIDLTTLDPGIRLDIRYATDNNFVGTPMYTSARAFLQRPAAEALLAAHRDLAAHGFGLLIHDAYRPWAITKVFRLCTPKELHGFVADPEQGSRHNRGCAVDLTLYDLKTGEPAEMPGLYDEMSPRSAPGYPGGTSAQRRRRDLLRQAMEAQGFRVNEVEWWHFDHKDWAEYPILNVRFEDL